MKQRSPDQSAMGRSRRYSRTSKLACLQRAPLPVSFLAQPAKHDATRARASGTGTRGSDGHR
eukprot:5638527-Alexandrium_andersonii.AAC.1